MDAVQEVKGRLNIEDVVSEYVQLKRAGRNFKGLSPFTSEKTPSFIVSPEKQIWHDFSSSKGGDMFTFIEQMEGVDFKGALEILARKAGVDLSNFQRSGGSGKSKERLFEAVDAAVSFYQVELTKKESALKYVRHQRKFTKQTIIDFRFGYSPNKGTALHDYLINKGFSKKELKDSGLVTERNGRVIDMFRDRLMVPLRDAQGRPVGFTARLLKKDDNAPKYINTPATILYDKSRQLFGFSQAKEHIRKTGYVVVVEGNLDVVASHQAGVGQVVASAGTALTTHHLKQLQRFTGDVRLAFDDDRAGQEAAERTIPLAQELGLELSFISIPAGKDPDELIRQDVSEWQKTVDSPVYMIDWLVQRIASQVDLKTAPGKRQFTTKVLEIVRQLSDEVEREHYVRDVAKLTNSSVESVSKKLNTSVSTTTKRLKKPQTSQPEEQIDVEHRKREQHFLSIAMTDPESRPVFDKIPHHVYSSEAQDFLKRSDSLQTVKNNDEYAKILTLLFEETYQHTDKDELAYQTKHLANRLVELYTKKKKNEIVKKLETTIEGEEQALLEEVKELEALRRTIGQM